VTGFLLHLLPKPHHLHLIAAAAHSATSSGCCCLLHEKRLHWLLPLQRHIGGCQPVLLCTLASLLERVDAAVAATADTPCLLLRPGHRSRQGVSAVAATAAST
jgi:hypothetical protein